MDNKKSVRVSTKSDPAKVSSSILYILESGIDVEITALGSASEVLVKAICLTANLNKDKLLIQFLPSMVYIQDAFGVTRNAVQFNIVLKR